MFKEKEKKEYLEPEVLVIKFGSEDIITSSPDNDPYRNDPFDD